SGQEGQADSRVSDDHGPELRRGAAGDRLAAVDRQPQGRDPRQLAARRRRDHRRLCLPRASEADVPAGLGSAASVHPNRAPTELKGLTMNEIYTTGTWTPYPGKEEEFIRAW